jgi:glucose-1-phosphate thymidylyltransferase
MREDTDVKGVILAGGMATRLGPLARAVNKHLLPLGREPMVGRAIRALAEAGVEEAMVVTGSEHLDAFARLDSREFGLANVRLGGQQRPGGIAQALAVASQFVDGAPVAVLLADNIYQQSLRPWLEAFARQERGARALLSRQAAGLDQCGVPVLCRDTGRIRCVEEKPRLPASAYAVTGAYAFDAHVWDILPSLHPSARGELEITDVLNCYAERGLLEHDVIDGFWADAGQSVEAYYAACDFVRQEAA